MNPPKCLRIGYWNMAIAETPLEAKMDLDSFPTIRWGKHKYGDRFFEDPFLYRADQNFYYIFAEEYEFEKKKGVIVLLKIDRSTMKLEDKHIVIDDDYHLSYPFLYEGCIIAENYKSGCLSKFTLEGSDRPVSVKKETLLDVPLIDPTVVELGDTRYLFGTTKENVVDANSRLSIFIEKNGEFVPHKTNPVVVDIHTARPGGSFFWYNGDLYRPAQSCEKMYGEHINLMRVKCLTEDKYEEEFVKSVSSHDSKRYNLCLHTFNTYKDFAIVDGYEYSIQIRQRIKGVIQAHRRK